jgi:hypothetical protein
VKEQQKDFFRGFLLPKKQQNTHRRACPGQCRCGDIGPVRLEPALRQSCRFYHVFPGPILGAFSEAEYIEIAVQMEPGDVLTVFTDGLTEAGPTHKTLLTIDGIESLLREAPHPESAQAIMSHLIAGVEAFAQEGVRDDQCLLVAIAA